MFSSNRPKSAIGVVATLVAIAAFAFSGMAAQAQAPTAVDFSQPSQFGGAALSPDGDKLAFFLQARGQTVVAVLDIPLSPSSSLRSLPLQPATQGRWVEWASQSRLLYATQQTRSFTDRRGDTVLGAATDLYSASADLSEQILLNQAPPNTPAASHPRPQFFDSVTNMLDDDPEHILQTLSWREWGTADLYRTNILTGEMEVVEEGRPGTFGFTADQQGRPRLQWGYPRTTRNQSNYFMFIRAAEEGSAWREASEHIRDDNTNFRPFGFGADPNILYVGSDHATDTVALYPFDMRTGQFGEILYEHPSVDVTGIVVSVQSDELIGVTYTEDEPQRFYFEQRAEEAMNAVRDLVGGGTVSTRDVSAESDTYLVVSSAPEPPSRIYMYDGTTDEATLIGSTQPRLANASLGSVHAVSFNARDGLSIPGYLTLPPGIDTIEQARNLPFVVLVHGGPAARDFRRFDWWTQFIATRGYGVMQINFRGSTGYGRDFHQAGAGQWGRGMQDDVDDAANWLIEQGMAQPDKIAVVGASYGGYAALMAVSRPGSPYVAGVSLNGVSDLAALRNHQRNFRLGLRAFDNTLEGVDLRAMSPVNRAAAFSRPLLLAQSTQDRTVPLEQAELMRTALDRANRQYTYLELPNSDHGITDQPNRQAFLEALEVFLAQHIGQ